MPWSMSGGMWVREEDQEASSNGRVKPEVEMAEGWSKGLFPGNFYCVIY